MSEAAGVCPRCGFENVDSFRLCPDCGFPLMWVAGKYELQSELSQGGMGRLFLARHTRLSERPERAIKVLHERLFDSTIAVERFHREVQVTAALSLDNEHIVRVFDDFGEERGLGHYFVMEHLEGKPLSEVMPRGFGMPPSLALHLFEQVCEGLQVAHSRGILHRDIKPDNIILLHHKGDPHFVKVIDFGIARRIVGSGGPHLTNESLGTPLYMSPEQCANDPVDYRSDLYSLAILLYELLSGHHPFSFDSEHPESISVLQVLAAHLNDQPTPLVQGLPELPHVSDVLMKAMHKEPEQRYPTLEAFRQAVVDAYAQDSKKGAEPDLSEKQTNKSHLSPGLVWGGVALLALLLFGWWGAEWARSGFFSSPHKNTHSLTPKVRQEGASERTSPSVKKRKARPVVLKRRVKESDERPKPRTRKAPVQVRVEKPGKRPSRFVARPKRSRPIRSRRRRRLQGSRRRPALSRAPTVRSAKPDAHPCGTAKHPWHWVLATTANRTGRKTKVRFPSCSECRVVKQVKGYCLRVWLKSGGTQVQLSAPGYQSCTFRVKKPWKTLRWKLKVEDALELADESYRCVKSRR